MHKWTIAFVILVTALGASAGLVALGLDDAPPAPLEPISDTELVFVDEFNGTSLNTAAWSTCYWWAQNGCTIASNDELEWYLPNQVSVQDGRAFLRAEARESVSPDGTDYEYTSGLLSTGPATSRSAAKFAFTFGRVEARMKLPVGEGLWPAFWLLSADTESRPEVDIIEVYGREPDVARMNIHVRNSYGQEVDDGRDWRSPTPLLGEWHTFALDWRPGRLEWLVDGTTRWTLDGENVPSSPMYIIANLAVGGQAGPLGTGSIPAEMEIDYVKVFAHPETQVAR